MMERRLHIVHVPNVEQVISTFVTLQHDRAVLSSDQHDDKMESPTVLLLCLEFHISLLLDTFPQLKDDEDFEDVGSFGTSRGGPGDYITFDVTRGGAGGGRPDRGDATMSARSATMVMEEDTSSVRSNTSTLSRTSQVSRPVITLRLKATPTPSVIEPETFSRLFREGIDQTVETNHFQCPAGCKTKRGAPVYCKSIGKLLTHMRDCHQDVRVGVMFKGKAEPIVAYDEFEEEGSKTSRVEVLEPAFGMVSVNDFVIEDPAEGDK
jgi:hypothetical protein